MGVGISGTSYFSLTNNNNQKEIFLGLEYNYKMDGKLIGNLLVMEDFLKKLIGTILKILNLLEIQWPTPKKFEILGLSINWIFKIMLFFLLNLFRYNESSNNQLSDFRY